MRCRQVLSCLVSSCPVLSCLFLSCRALSCLFCPVSSCRALPSFVFMRTQRIKIAEIRYVKQSRFMYAGLIFRRWWKKHQLSTKCLHSKAGRQKWYVRGRFWVGREQTRYLQVISTHAEKEKDHLQIWCIGFLVEWNLFQLLDQLGSKGPHFALATTFLGVKRPLDIDNLTYMYLTLIAPSFAQLIAARSQREALKSRPLRSSSLLSTNRSSCTLKPCACSTLVRGSLGG
jgi:hypothetical protein